MTRFVSALRRAPHFRITGERQRLLASFAAVFLFGLLAHGYAFTNFTVSHDSLNEMFLSGDIRYAAGSVADWKISLGRFLYPAYRAVFSGGAGTPWLSGVLSLVWVSLAVYLVSRLFSVDNALLLAVIGALFVTNVSYSALAATYIYDLDGDMLAMLLAVCAAYLLLRGTLRRRALAVIPIVGSLALYQAMISVTVSLVMIACILRLLESESAKAVFFDGLKAVGILFIGGAAYYILVRAVCSASGVALDGGYNSLLSLGRMTPDLLPEAVRSTYDTWARSTVRQPVFVPLPITRAGHLLLAVLTLAATANRSSLRERSRMQCRRFPRRAAFTGRTICSSSGWDKKAQRPASTRRPLCFIIFTSMRCGIRDRGRRPPARPRSPCAGFPASASPWTRDRWR